MDWAREIAEKLEVGIEGQGPEQFIAAMSVQLRKVAVEHYLLGVKETGEYMRTSIKDIVAGGDGPDLEALAAHFTARASEIGKGAT